jgi:hypothetical protein
MPLSVYLLFRFGKYSILPNSFLPLFVYAPFRFGKYLIMPVSFMPLFFMPLSFMPSSVSAPFRLCLFSVLMEMVDYAGFLYASFRRPESWPSRRVTGVECLY